MKSARTYVFVFVPILLEQVANTRVATGFQAGSNGSSPPNRKHEETSHLPARHREEFETQILPGDLFWTWFVDNPRRSSLHNC